MADVVAQGGDAIFWPAITDLGLTLTLEGILGAGDELAQRHPEDTGNCVELRCGRVPRALFDSPDGRIGETSSFHQFELRHAAFDTFDPYALAQFDR
ncbi:hypothetical protein AWH04_08860 [Rhodococcus erythropolis]|jgi:hypothetical protein|nr:hypothetical protein AWH04_08860 [Rhodococcus erythropolis]